MFKSDAEVIFLRSSLGSWISFIVTFTLLLTIASTVILSLHYHDSKTSSSSASSVTQPPLLSVTSAIIVIDVQNDFLINRTYPNVSSVRYTNNPLVTINSDGTVSVSSGALPVVHTEDLASGINAFIKKSNSYLPKVVFTLDWHPTGHCSYYGNTTIPNLIYTPQSDFTEDQINWRCHDDRSQRSFSYGSLVQWAPHCTANSAGARFDPGLIIPDDSFIVKKGYEPTLDSYSGMYGRQSVLNSSDVDVIDEGQAGLWNMKSTMELLNDLSVRDIFLVGVASDYCVYNSAIDAVNYVSRVGGTVYIVTDLVRAVNAGDAEVKFRELAGMGVQFYNSSDLFT